MDSLVKMAIRVAARHQAREAARHEAPEGGPQLAKILVNLTSNYLQNPDLAESAGITKDTVRAWRELDQALRHNDKAKATILVRRNRQTPAIRIMGDDIMTWAQFGVA